MADRLVMIVSNPEDGHVGAVLPHLEATGCRVFVLAPERFGRDQRLSIAASTNGDRIVLERDGASSVDLADVSAVWYRRPRLVGLAEFALESDGIEFAREEWRAALEATFALLDDVLWVSHPDCLRTAARKPVQLRLARELGLRVPATVITNDPDAVRAFFRACDGRVVVKATGSGWIGSAGDGAVRYVLTNRIGTDDLASIADVVVAPVTVQEEIPKAYEVRVNVIGRSLLPIRIDSQGSPISALDWRRYDVERTPYSPYRLPAEVGDRCLELTRRLGLEFGAIDLIRTPDGEYVFLEINGNGQFHWAEELSGVQVGAVVADLLAGRIPSLTQPTLAQDR